jgi:hypothetical protein
MPASPTRGTRGFGLVHGGVIDPSGHGADPHGTVGLGECGRWTAVSIGLDESS